MTDSNGEYTFIGLLPGNFTLSETSSASLSSPPWGDNGDVSDYDEDPDGDFGDKNTVLGNKIVVTITPC